MLSRLHRVILLPPRALKENLGTPLKVETTISVALILTDFQALESLSYSISAEMFALMEARHVFCGRSPPATEIRRGASQVQNFKLCFRAPPLFEVALQVVSLECHSTTLPLL